MEALICSLFSGVRKRIALFKGSHSSPARACYKNIINLLKKKLIFVCVSIISHHIEHSLWSLERLWDYCLGI
jgi:hypothetical protein